MAEITDDFGRVNNFGSADLESIAKSLRSAVGEAVKYMSDKSKEDSDLGDRLEELRDSLEELGDDVREGIKSNKDLVEKVKDAAEELARARKERSAGETDGIKATQQEHTKLLAAILRSQQKALSEKAAKFTSGGTVLSAARRTSRGPSLKDFGFKPKARDVVPAMLARDEYIVSRKGAKGNRDLLDAINRGYFKGGVVKPAYLSTGSESGSTRPIPGAPSSTPTPTPTPTPIPTPIFPDIESIFRGAGEEAAESFSENLEKGLRKRKAQWFTGISTMLLGGYSFPQILFSGAVKDALDFRVQMREIAFQTQGVTGDLRGLQAEFANLGNSIVAETGQSVDALQKVYIKNLKKGFQENKAGLKVMKSGLFLSTMIGSEAEQTADLFGDWYRTLRLSAEQMDTMAFSMKDVARLTGVTGDELVGAMKSSEGLLKNLRNQGNLTTGATKALITIMAEAKKSGTEDSTGKIMEALTSTNKLLSADDGTKALVFSMTSRMEATNPGASRRALSGTLMNTREDRNAFADSIMSMMSDFTGGKMKSLDDFEKLDEMERFHLTMRLKAVGLEIDQAKELYKQIKKSSAPMSERVAEIDKIANSKFSTEEEKKLAKQQKNELYMSEGMNNLAKLREKSSKIGIEEALKELRSDKDFQAQMKDFSGMSGALTDSMKRQFGLSGSESQIQSQMDNMSVEKKLELSSLITAQKTAEIAKEKGIEYKDFGPDMEKALQRGDSKAFNEAYDSFISERKKLETQMEADTDPTKALTKSMTELNETIRKYTSSFVGGIIDLLGAFGLLAGHVALHATALATTFGKGVMGKMLSFGMKGSLDDFAKTMSDSLGDGMFKKFFKTYSNSRTPSTDSRMLDIAEYRKFRKQGFSPIDAKKQVEKMGGFSKGKSVLGSLNDAASGLRDDMVGGLAKMRGSIVDFFQNAGKASARFFNKFISGFKFGMNSSGNFLTAMTKGFKRAMHSSDATRGILVKMGGVLKNVNVRYAQSIESLRKISPALAKFTHHSAMLGKAFMTMKFGELFKHFGKAMRSGFQIFKNAFNPKSWTTLFSKGMKGMKGAILGGSLGTAQLIFTAIDTVFGAVSGFMNTGKNFEGVMKAMGKSTKDVTWGMYASSTVAGALVGIVDGLTFGLLSMTGAAKWLNETLSLVLYTVFSFVEGIVEGILYPFRMVWFAVKHIGAQFKGIGDSILGVFNAIAGIFGAKAGNWSEAFAMIYPWLKAIGRVVGYVVGMPLAGFLWLVVKGISAVLVPLQMLIAAVAGVIKVIASFAKFFVDIFRVGLWQATKNLGWAVWEAISGVFRPVTDFLWSLMGDILAPFQWLANILCWNSIVPDMVMEIVKWFAMLPLRIFGFLVKIPIMLGKALLKIPSVIGDMYSKIGSYFQSFGNDNVFAAMLSQLGNLYSFIGGTIKNLVGIASGVLSVLQGIFTLDFGMIWEGVKQVGISIINQISNIGSFFYKTFKNAGTFLFKMLKKIPIMLIGAMKAVFFEFPSWLVGKLMDGVWAIGNFMFLTLPKMMWDGFKKAISGMGKYIWDTLTWPFKKIGELLKAVFYDFPIWLGTKIMDGLKAVFYDLPMWLGGVIASGLQAVFYDLPMWLGKTIWDGMGKIVSGIPGAIYGALHSAASAIGLGWLVEKIAGGKKNAPGSATGPAGAGGAIKTAGSDGSFVLGATTMIAGGVALKKIAPKVVGLASDAFGKVGNVVPKNIGKYALSTFNHIKGAASKIFGKLGGFMPKGISKIANNVGAFFSPMRKSFSRAMMQGEGVFKAMSRAVNAQVGSVLRGRLFGKFTSDAFGGFKKIASERVSKLASSAFGSIKKFVPERVANAFKSAKTMFSPFSKGFSRSMAKGEGVFKALSRGVKGQISSMTRGGSVAKFASKAFERVGKMIPSSVSKHASGAFKSVSTMFSPFSKGFSRSMAKGEGLFKALSRGVKGQIASISKMRAMNKFAHDAFKNVKNKGVLPKGVQKLATDSFKSFKNVFSPFSKGFSRSMAKGEGVFKALSRGVKGQMASVLRGGTITKAASQAFEKIGKMVPASVNKYASSAFNSIKHVPGKIAKMLSGGGGGLLAKTGAVAKGLYGRTAGFVTNGLGRAGGVSGALGKVGGFASNVVGKAGGALGKVGGFAGGIVGKTGSMMGSVAGKGLGALAKKIPVVGALLDFGIRKAQGQTTGKAAVGAGGSLAGAAAGAAIGTAIFPVVGTAIGAIVGGLGGGWLADKLYDNVGPVFETVGKGISESASFAWEGMKKVGSTLWEGAKGIGSKIWEGTKNLASKVSDGAKWLSENVGSAMFAPIGLISKGIRGLGSWLFGWGGEKKEGKENTAANMAMARIEAQTVILSTAVGQHAIPTVRPEGSSDMPNVEPVHLRDITDSILRERAGSGTSKLQSDELTRMEEAAYRQVEELEQIREGIREMVSILKPKGGSAVGESYGAGPGRTKDPRRPLHAANFGKMKYGKMGGNANRSLVNNGES